MKQYFCYVIQLDPKVAERKKFRIKNPKYLESFLKNCKLNTYPYMRLSLEQSQKRVKRSWLEKYRIQEHKKERLE